MEGRGGLGFTVWHRIPAAECGAGGPEAVGGCLLGRALRCAGGQLVCHLSLLSFAKPECKNELKKT